MTLEESNMSEATQTPLSRLILFMICLAIAGSIVAGAHYYAVDLPVQNAVTQQPANCCRCPPPVAVSPLEPPNHCCPCGG